MQYIYFLYNLYFYIHILYKFYVYFKNNIKKKSLFLFNSVVMQGHICDQSSTTFNLINLSIIHFNIANAFSIMDM